MQLIKSIFKGTKKKIIGLCVWKLIVDYFYADIVTDLWSYQYHIADYNYTKLIYSWILFLFFLIIGQAIKPGILMFSFEFLMFFSLIPTLTVWWVRNANNICMYEVCLYWFIWAIASILIGKTSLHREFESPNSCEKEISEGSKTNFIFMYMVLTICSFFTLLFSYKYGDMRLYVKLEDVYSVRLVGENNMSSLEAYWFGWLTGIILPLTLLFFLKAKKWWWTIWCCGMLTISYAIYGNKSILFVIPLTIAFYIVKDINFAYELSNYFIWAGIVIMILSCCLEKLGITIWGVGLVNRMTTEIAVGHFFYFDFFQKHEFLLLRQSVLRFLLENPYDKPIGIIIGSDTAYNLTGNYNNFNNGVFSDAYANFGIVGVIMYPILFVVTLQTLGNILKKYQECYIYLIFSLLLLYCMSIGYFQWLLSGGVIFSIFALALYDKVKFKI